jgi:nicotinate-nucleotide pyrophosphorylase (carboxylating)
VETLIELALQEDLGAGDWTTDSLIPPDHQTRCAILAQAEGVLCGVEVAKQVFQRLDSSVRFPRRAAGRRAPLARYARANA